MWCKTCQQDTPGVAHAATGRIVCSRCQQPVRSRKATAHARISDDGIALDEQSTTPTATATAPTFAKDDWSSQQRVRTLARELKRPTFAASKSSASVFADRRRFEPPHDFFNQLDRLPATPQTLASETLSAAIRRQSDRGLARRCHRRARLCGRRRPHRLVLVVEDYDVLEPGTRLGARRPRHASPRPCISRIAPVALQPLRGAETARRPLAARPTPANGRCSQLDALRRQRHELLRRSCPHARARTHCSRI